jgi:arylsulfatase A-like enzyme
MKNITSSRRRFLGAAGAGALGGLLNSQSTFSTEVDGAEERDRDIRSGARKPPNIILFMPDELRADALACYGNPVVKTPNFDQLANRGTRFANCHVQYPICGPSRCSMLTGWPVSVRGHRSQSYFLRNDEPNLFRYLRQAGYDVFWFGKNDALAAESFYSSVTEWNFSDGWDIGDNESAPPPASARKDYRKEPTTFLGQEGGDPRKTKDFGYIEAAIQVLQRREHERPFCIFLPVGFPHPPYRAPKGFYGVYDPSTIKDLSPVGVRKKPDYLSSARTAYRLEDQPPKLYQTIRAGYYDAVSYCDWMFGQLLDAVDASGHRNDTAIVVCSDHGDYAGDYGMVEKWPSGLEDQLTHVPLIVSMPGQAGGRQTTDLVMLFDAMATCLEIAGVEANHTHFARSLMPYVRGEQAEARLAIFAEGGYNSYEPQCFEHPPQNSDIYYARLHLQVNQPQTVTRAAMVRTQDYKLILRPAGQSELYRYRDDPRELNNLYDEPGTAGIQGALKEQLLEWYIATAGVAPMDKDQRGFPPFRPDPVVAPVRTEFPFVERQKL